MPPASVCSSSQGLVTLGAMHEFKCLPPFYSVNMHDLCTMGNEHYPEESPADHYSGVGSGGMGLVAGSGGDSLALSSCEQLHQCQKAEE